MHGFVDLHTHSSASDGTDMPSEILRKAAAIGLDAVALTDHDTLSGMTEFMNEAVRYSVRAVPGVEVSTYFHGKELHIIGLFTDPENDTLRDFLLARRNDRDRRNREMILKLREGGYDITEEEVNAFAKGEAAGRPHIARALIEKGYFTDIKEVFLKCLRRGARFYVPRTPVPPEEAIRVIRCAGGIAVWAHPVLAADSRSAMRRILKCLIPAGLSALETYYSIYSAEQHEMAGVMAREFHLLESGGSDYHGVNHPGIQLGCGTGALRIPAELLSRLEEARNSLHAN